ncbi:MAG: hypothetical protein AAFR87_20125 [Bacteroidota bacterium]
MVEEAVVKSAPKIVSKRKSNGSLKLGGNSFEAIQSQLKEKAELKKQLSRQQEVDIAKEINPDIEIDFAAFESHLADYVEKLKSQNKMNLASAILNGKNTFTHNKWVLAVENHIFKGYIEQEQYLLPYLREKLNQSSIFIEVIVDESLLPQKEEIPYTEEGKLEAMNKKNPLVQKLQKIFKTRIIYE